MSSEFPALDAELKELANLGWVVTDRDIAERLLRLVGVVVALRERHGFDARGRCTLCRPKQRRLARRRRRCTVHQALATFRIGQCGPDAHDDGASL
jgi:hypothetical protein